MAYLYAQPNGHNKNGNAKYIYGKAPWRWTNDEFDDIVDTITKIRTPTGYGSSFKRKLTVEWKVVGMKTHDWHNLLQDFLLVAVWGTLIPDVRETIYRFGQFFRWVCSKEIKISNLPKL